MTPIFAPKESLTTEEKRQGLRGLMIEGPFSQAMVMMTTGAFLISFTLAIQDSNKLVGFIVSIGSLMMVFQTPAALIIERIRNRKRIALVTALIARLIWPLIAISPFVLPKPVVMPTIIGLLFFRYLFANASGIAWGSWIRDLVPDRIMGRFFSYRLAVMIGIGAVIAFLSGLFVDYWTDTFGSALAANAIILGSGGVFGLLALIVMMRMPEPMMAVAAEPAKSTAFIIEPFKDKNYRNWLIFVGFWNFASSMSGPFIIVHMLKRLDISMTWVQGFAILSQTLMVALLPIWGRVSDKLGSKTVLRVATNLIVLTFLLWTFTTLPKRHALMPIVLVATYIIGGIGWGGFASASSVLPLKNAPKDRSTSYFSASALVSGIASTIGPLTGGLLADAFKDMEFSIPLRFAISGETVFSFPAFSFSSFDFLFLLSFLIGSLAVHRLKYVHEKVESKEEEVRPEMIAQLQRTLRQIGHTMGIRLTSAVQMEKPQSLSRTSARLSRVSATQAIPVAIASSEPSATPSATPQDGSEGQNPRSGVD